MTTLRAVLSALAIACFMSCGPAAAQSIDEGRNIPGWEDGSYRKEVFNLTEALARMRQDAEEVSFISRFDYYSKVNGVSERPINANAVWALLDRRKSLWLQGDTKTCARQAIALNLTLNGRFTPGDEVVQAARPFVELDILLFGKETPWYGGKVHAPKLAFLEMKKKALMRFGAGHEAVRGADKEILARINQAGMSPGESRLAKALSYGIRHLGSDQYSDFHAGWKGDKAAQARFLEGSAKIKEMIKKEVAEHKAVLVVVSAGSTWGYDFHAINVIDLAMRPSGEEVPVLFDSNHGLLTISWNDFYPVQAWVITPDEPRRR